MSAILRVLGEGKDSFSRERFEDHLTGVCGIFPEGPISVRLITPDAKYYSDKYSADGVHGAYAFYRAVSTAILGALWTADVRKKPSEVILLGEGAKVVHLSPTPFCRPEGRVLITKTQLFRGRVVVMIPVYGFFNATADQSVGAAVECALRLCKSLRGVAPEVAQDMNLENVLRGTTSWYSPRGFGSSYDLTLQYS